MSHLIRPRPKRKQPRAESTDDNRPVCHNCEHYYITWDQNFPYGCRAMGFKSRKRPSQDVYESSGMDCQLFTRKKGSSTP